MVSTFIAARTRPAALALALLLCSGCWQPPAPTAHQLDVGLIWMFPGVEGGPWSLKPAHDAMRDGGIDAAIRIHDWERPFGTIANLTAYQRNRADARRIAGEIGEYHASHPEAPIDLVGYSGGGGMAVMVAEALPEDVPLRRLILVQAALSQRYDLCKALRRVQGRLVSFYSPMDWVILGVGTRTLGTMDRRFEQSAGLAGFEVAQAIADEKLRSRFEQRGWTREMLQQGHYGGHFPILLYSWNRKYIVPCLSEERGGARPAPPGEAAAFAPRVHATP